MVYPGGAGVTSDGVYDLGFGLGISLCLNHDEVGEVSDNEVDETCTVRWYGPKVV